MGKLAQALSHHAENDAARFSLSDGRTVLTRSQLAAWVAGAAADLGQTSETIGIFGSNSIEWAVAFLAASVAGKTIVPVPTFFSAEQCSHLIRDAGIKRIIVTDTEGVDGYNLPALALSERRAATLSQQASDGGMIIYTSGSTGNPKGVRLARGQALWSAMALAKASGATAEDKYLSVLPLPMLLEIICGIITPVLVGGSVHFDAAIARSVASGTPANIAEAFEAARPTTSVLVPQLLALYAAQLSISGKRPPESLRFVAVGGAPLPAALNAAATKLGIPVYEGYGLSECASVVAVSRPGASRAGSVGRPLPGLRVDIEDDEIVVEGPSVMDGYLHAESAPRRWRTGDMGAIDADGFLTVYGRRDNLIVTPYGRNVNPEWIETMLLGDPRIGACVLCQVGTLAHLIVLLIPSRLGEIWFCAASQTEIDALIAHGCQGAPEYARPRSAIVIFREEAISQGLFTPNGRIKRTGVVRYLQDKLNSTNTKPLENMMSTFERLYLETTEDRNRFLSIPLVKHALATGGSRELYLEFLTQAYHHVKHTFPLLCLAATHTKDEHYQDALFEYMKEERGHDKWILDDIRALGGDANAVEQGKPAMATQVMVAYAYYSIQWISPYAILGMVHVLEGLSVMLAHKVAGAVQRSLAVDGRTGFSYLSSHGTLDIEHVALFKSLINSFEDRQTQDIIIEASRVMYRLYGAIFEDIGVRYVENAHAA
jgi:long-chain acyl-CoA synthetase